MSKGNDLAVITLAAPMKTTATVAPTTGVGPGEDAIWGGVAGVVAAPERGPWLVGWGNTAPDGPVAMPRIAMDANPQVLPDTSCTSGYWGTGFQAALNMCVGGERTDDPIGAGACNGDSDSGGSFVANANGAWRVVGVVSYGAKPCKPAQPSVFVKVATYRARLQGLGVPVGTGAVAGPLPAPAVTGGGKVLPPGAPVTIESPTEAIALNGFDAQLDARWMLRSDQDASELVIRREGVESSRMPVRGYIGYRMSVGQLPHGSDQWCITTVDDVSAAPGGEACQSFSGTAEHIAGLRSASVRGRRATFTGRLVSTEPNATVSVQIKVRRAVRPLEAAREDPRRRRDHSVLVLGEGACRLPAEATHGHDRGRRRRLQAPLRHRADLDD